MSSVFVQVQREALHSFVANTFRSSGMSEEDSLLATEVLCYADENGFDTHGVANLDRIYISSQQDGRIHAQAQYEIVTEAPGTALMDARNGLGLIAGARAMELAIEKAKNVGIGCVVVRHSSHFGSAGYYTGKALEAGMIGMAMTNLGSQTIARPIGGKVAMIGTNPIAVSAPAGEVPPFVLDMSTTVVATGKIQAARRRGESIPEGWLIDDEGKTVTDPNAYFDGTGHLQMLGGSLETGGAKGYGLGLMVDILCGVLSGANVGPDPRLLEPDGQRYGQEDQNIGHFFLAINIDAFRPKDEFKSHMDRMLLTLLGCPTDSSVKQVVYPGYLETVRKQASDLVQLDITVYEQLTKLANRLGLSELKVEKEVSVI
ncbi:Malate/lactate/ureidoglycolate dehydrogenase, LDH2 family [Fontibacillus panacisegetis]|uniref:Malate/lactate/ureidoglycolate dehydrogenase, LDH2 family n=1 Tax=Fontibacillus panacisegetis TaxID=670482 RepID=A0A1G7J4K9_9BACL|nr:Ldh family oxidoreductase [Fontibacillus panacisegetis]SDF19860.1 Malate/lactate/ureidoglycolate dehydrogenase, LDH2 family [Fontibacillus panacisegetis]